MNFPGHRYLGPGNSTDNGPPVDSDDAIARDHDIAYESAGSSEDIRASDREAIQRFTGDFFGSGNWHSAVGAVGLGVKYGVETVTGVLYPTSSTLKRQQEINETTPNKKGKMSDNNMEHSGNAQESAASGTSVAGPGQASEHTNVMMKQMPAFHKGKLVFRHSRIMYSYGYQFKSFYEQFVAGPDNIKQSVTTTPFAFIPCHGVPWYLTNAEFEELPVTSAIKECGTVVTPMGYRTPFITNSSTVSAVNSNLLVFGAYAFGLNNRFNGANFELSSDASNPMYPTAASLQSQEGVWQRDYWGERVAKGQDRFAFDQIPACFGNMKHMALYYGQNVDMIEGGCTLPDIMQVMNIFPMINGVGNEPIVWSYKPQVNILKPVQPYAPFRPDGTTARLRIKYGEKTHVQQEWDVQYNSSGNSPSILQKTDIEKTSVSVPYESYIEQAGSTSHGFMEYGGGVKPPSLHVGILPVHAYSSTSISDTQVQEVVAFYKIDTYCKVEYSFNFTHTFDTYVPPNLATWSNNATIKIGSTPHWANGYRASWISVKDKTRISTYKEMPKHDPPVTSAVTPSTSTTTTQPPAKKAKTNPP